MITKLARIFFYLMAAASLFFAVMYAREGELGWALLNVLCFGLEWFAGWTFKPGAVDAE